MKPQDADELLKTLGAHARAQQAAGTAIASTHATDPQIGLPENFKAALTVAANKGRVPAYEAAMRGLGITPPVKPPGRKVFGAHWWSWLVPSLALPAFAAVAFALWPAADGVKLPSYEMQTHGVAELRGETEPESLIVKPGVTLQVVLRPAVAVTAPVQAKLYWLHANQLIAWPVPVEVAESGAMRVRGTFIPGWQTRTGDELVAFVGPAHSLANFKLADVTAPPQGVQVLRRPVTWQN